MIEKSIMNLQKDCIVTYKLKKPNAHVYTRTYTILLIHSFHLEKHIEQNQITHYK